MTTIFVTHLISESTDHYYLAFDKEPTEADIETVFKSGVSESEWEYISDIETLPVSLTQL